MIRQVFVNLLSNAIKFTRPKETGIIEIGCIVKENQNICYVKLPAHRAGLPGNVIFSYCAP
jgi:signal transduction histidine kinase